MDDFEVKARQVEDLRRIESELSQFGADLIYPRGKLRVSPEVRFEQDQRAMCASACMAVTKNERTAFMRTKLFYDPASGDSLPLQTVIVSDGSGRQLRTYDKHGGNFHFHAHNSAGVKDPATNDWSGSLQDPIDFVRLYLEGRLDGIS